MLNFFKKYDITREIFLYIIIGSLSAGTDSISFVIFRNFNINIYFANFISINIGISLSFFLNSCFNFKKTDNMFKRAISFFSIGYLGLILSMIILFIGTRLMNINEIIIKLISIFFIAILQFILNKFITFRKV